MAPCSTLSMSTLSENSNFSIYLTRHGESLNNLYGKIGGDAGLSSRGEQYAKTLAAFFKSLELPNLEVWVTQYSRTQQTAEYFECPRILTPELGEIKAGDHDGLTYEDIAAEFPLEFALRDKDKLHYRYPGGESYIDVVQRVKPLIDQMRKQDNLLIISHQATLRCLLSLLLNSPMAELPYMKIPLHTVLKVTLNNGEVKVEHLRLPVDCVDTHRARPMNCKANREIKEACQTVPFHL